VVVNVDMFHKFVEFKIRGNLDYRLIIVVQLSRLNKRSPKVLKNVREPLRRYERQLVAFFISKK